MCDGVLGFLGSVIASCGVCLQNSYQSSIQMVLYESLYGRWCRCLVGWFEPGEARLRGTDLVQDALEKVIFIQDRLRTAQSR